VSARVFRNTTVAGETQAARVPSGRPARARSPHGRQPGGRSPSALFALPALVFLVVFFGAPVVLLLVASFHGVNAVENETSALTISQYVQVFTTPYFNEAFLSTLEMALEVTAICLVCGYAIAWSLVHQRRPVVRALLYAIVVSPLMTSVVVRSYGWIILLSGSGPINALLLATHVTSKPLSLLYTTQATLVSVTQVLLPFAVIPATPAIANVDENMIRAATSLGASRRAVFLQVILPQTASGVMAGGIIVFIVAMGIYVTPLLVGGVSQALLATRVYVEATTVFDLPLSAALSVMLLLMTLIVVGAVSFVFRVWERRTYGEAG
jgi:putative spermidine/putrescine transport system permease protein